MADNPDTNAPIPSAPKQTVYHLNLDKYASPVPSDTMPHLLAILLSGKGGTGFAKAQKKQ